MATIVEDFHRVHQRVFGISDPCELVEFDNWGVQAIAKMPEVIIKVNPHSGEDPACAFINNRKAYYKELGGLFETPVYCGEKLFHGCLINGPAIIQEPITTIVVFPGSCVTVSKWGNYLIDIE